VVWEQVGLPTRVKLLGTPQLPQWFRLHQGKLNEAYELFTEAFTILQQVCGPMHREVANCCRYLAMVLYHAGDMAGAIMQQHKELIINERCLGPDHPDTAHSYGNMALFYHGLNQTELALRHMARTLLLLNVSCGSDHPDVAATFINIAMMYQDIGKMNVALRYLQEALKRNERLLGHEHIQTAVCYHALAIAFNCMGAYKLSLQHERSTYNILVKQLGEEDSRTRESANWIKTFQIRENQAHAQKQRGQQSMSIAAVQKAAEALKVCNQPFCILFFADLHSAFVLLLRIGMVCCLQ
jgi:protein TIF31